MNGNTTTNGTRAVPETTHKPFQTVSDFLSNTSNFKIIESTLREGEQFSNAFFDTGMYTPFDSVGHMKKNGTLANL